MSKTLTLKRDVSTETPSNDLVEATAPTAQLVEPVKAFSREELLAMLQALPGGATPDPTQDLPIGPTPSHLIANKASLPPIDQRHAGPAPQVPPRALGRFDLNGIPVIAPQVDVLQMINPATGEAYIQAGPRPTTMIQPPPSRRFDGR